jgi:hypothetical protein
MDILKIYKLYLINPTCYPFPEWNLCEKLLGNLGRFEENKIIYLNNEPFYKYVSKYNKIYFNANNEINLNVNEKISLMEYLKILKLYFTVTYKLKDVDVTVIGLYF